MECNELRVNNLKFLPLHSILLNVEYPNIVRHMNTNAIIINNRKNFTPSLERLNYKIEKNSFEMKWIANPLKSERIYESLK